MIQEEIPEPKRRGRKRKEEPESRTAAELLEELPPVVEMKVMVPRRMYVDLLKAAKAEQLEPEIWISRLILTAMKEVALRSIEWFDE